MLGYKLRLLREEHHFDLSELAYKLYIHSDVLKAYESGKIEPTYKHLIKLAQLYNVSLDWLLGNSEHRECYVPNCDSIENRTLNILYNQLLIMQREY